MRKGFQQLLHNLGVQTNVQLTLSYEKNATLETIELEQVQVELLKFETNKPYNFILLGIGEVTYIQALLEHLPTYVHLHIIDVNQEQAIQKLYTYATETVLENPRIHWYLGEKESNVIDQFKQLNNDWTLPSIHVVLMNHLVENNVPYYQEILNLLSRASFSAEVNQHHLKRAGVLQAKNVLENLVDFVQQDALDTKVNTYPYAHIPAFAVSAGPSLQKQLSLLPKVRQKGIMVASGQGFKTLTNANVRPHFATNIDAGLYNLPHWEVVPMDVPVLYNALTQKEIMIRHQAHQTPRMWTISTETTVYNEWLQRYFPFLETPKYEAGPTVSIYTLRQLYRLGVRKVILLGQDLAYDANMKSHADQALRIQEEALLEVEGLHGEKIYTNYTWQYAHQAFEQFAKEHPDMEIINCSEAGYPIPGIPNRPLQEVLDEMNNLSSQEEIDMKLQSWFQPSYQSVSTIPNSLITSLESMKEYLNLLVYEGTAFLKDVVEIQSILEAGKGLLKYPLFERKWRKFDEKLTRYEEAKTFFDYAFAHVLQPLELEKAMDQTTDEKAKRLAQVQRLRQKYEGILPIAQELIPSVESTIQRLKSMK